VTSQLPSTSDTETAALASASGHPVTDLDLEPASGAATPVRAGLPRRGDPARKRRRLGRAYITISWLSPFLVLALWQAVCSLGHVSPQLLPPPGSVLSAAHQLWHEGQLQQAILVSLSRAAIGFLLGTVIGLAIGTLVGFSRLAAALIDRPVQMFRAIPFFAITPLVIVWFGVGEQGEVFLVALAVFFAIYINTTLGIRQVDPKLVEMGRAGNMPTRRIITHIVLPGAVPSILTGVRVGLTMAWLALVVAETLGATSGIGFLAENAREFLQTNIIVLVIVIYAVVGVLSDQLARLLERRLLAWHPNFAKVSA
jgi:sulfonate transport system permease protein